MFQLSKKVEYGLIALRHMAMKGPGPVHTAKELAQEYDIPYELLAKVLQRLAKAGILRSMQGVKGGYQLARKAGDLSVSQVIRIIEEERPMIAECYVDGADSCSIFDVCTIRKPLGKVQRNLNVLFDRMTIQEII
ncbi:MAG TPA: Rrf2 family transcriptional regulator [Bacteroidota bacterium]|nr:Rrf2 family transcriptional regulator [Bacteroidota bacterium]